MRTIKINVVFRFTKVCYPTMPFGQGIFKCIDHRFLTCLPQAGISTDFKPFLLICVNLCNLW
jgi:hypothetical protein